jgi:hypothetical protein
MARLVSFEPWDINTVNLNWYAVFETGSLLQTSGFTFQNTGYPDLFTVQANDGSDRRELDFLGSGITQDAAGNIVSGTVNAIIEVDLTTNTTLWYADGLLTSAVAIYNAALTPSNQDEINLIQAALTGNDSITGGLGNDILTGFSGSDTLTGGGGNDIFLDTKAGHNGDTITDFHIGDSIVFSDATLSSFTFSLSGNTLLYSGGSITLSNSPIGKFVETAASNGGVQLLLTKVTPPAPNDFNGDGKSDVFWRSDTGTLTDWLGQPNGLLAGNGANFNTAISSNWHIAGTGDFNGDGRVDLLWRADDGTVTDWLGQTNGGFIGNGANFNSNISSNWHIAGTGDFNGDGIDDILWRADDGTVTDWLGQSNGGFVGNGGNFNASISSNWHIVGTGDFNGDGRLDILWRADDGTVTDWLGQSNGGFAGNGANFNSNISSNWHIAGTGDFNGDGLADILWRADDGTMTDWLGQSNGGFSGNGANFNTIISIDWHIVSTGDFNGDGRVDILWENTNGTVTEWLGQSNGGFVGNGANVTIGMTSNWHVQDPFVHDVLGI